MALVDKANITEALEALEEVFMTSTFDRLSLDPRSVAGTMPLMREPAVAARLWRHFVEHFGISPAKAKFRYLFALEPQIRGQAFAGSATRFHYHDYPIYNRKYAQRFLKKSYRQSNPCDPSLSAAQPLPFGFWLIPVDIMHFHAAEPMQIHSPHIIDWYPTHGEMRSNPLLERMAHHPGMDVDLLPAPLNLEEHQPELGLSLLS
ncbi:hypothetical protein BDV96DRAFT_648098 [Lophiotrema nucula]|uniref:Uncharacterized protein n=1 Tax=Lophiotrema nucula TaxID=690887 RepID=A0A6A5Z610_9PLEO|nr:hypothetical protein BDV96DRAFT_648098 [Lophiotrema nucula]